jgi:hypothetical protein
MYSSICKASKNTKNSRPPKSRRPPEGGMFSCANNLKDKILAFPSRELERNVSNSSNGVRHTYRYVLCCGRCSASVIWGHIRLNLQGCALAGAGCSTRGYYRKASHYFNHKSISINLRRKRNSCTRQNNRRKR